MLFCYLSEEDMLALIDTTVAQPCSMINIFFPSEIKKTGGISSVWLLWDTANRVVIKSRGPGIFPGY